jgi:drug/metabolite transporter (DMT)-like permease
VTYIPPVVALLMGLVFAGEPLKPLHLLAMACILGGVYLLQSGRQPKPAQAHMRRSAKPLQADARL